MNVALLDAFRTGFVLAAFWARGAAGRENPLAGRAEPGARCAPQADLGAERGRLAGGPVRAGARGVALLSGQPERLDWAGFGMGRVRTGAGRS